MEIISAVYMIVNTVTGEFYIGSSKNVKSRWAVHKCQTTWKKCPNNPMYIDMRKYGVDKFEFQILEETEEGKLKDAEQKFIETLKPTYNSNRANGWDIERYKEHQKEYYQNNRESKKEYQKEYYQNNRESKKEYNKEYYQKNRESNKEYYSQLCSYNGEVLKLCALSKRFQRAGVEHPTAEAKKYLV